MKRLLVLLLTFTIVLSCLVACQTPSGNETDNQNGTESGETEKKPSSSTRLPAQSTSGEGFEFELSEDKRSYIFVSKGTCTDEKIVVPATHNEIPVLQIAEGAFSACSGVTEITVSEGIKTVGKDAFAFSKDLKKVTIADSVSSLGERAFFSCAALESVTLGKGLSSISVSTFEACPALSEITVPDNIKSIGSSAFYNCSALKSITLGNGLNAIGHSAFTNTAFAADESNWANGALYLGKYLISVKPEVSEALTVKDGTELIADQAAVRAKISALVLPSSLKYIGNDAFVACNGIKSVDIPEGVVSIGSGAFSSCDGLTEVSLPDTLTSIGSYAFYHCSALSGITIPEGITAISDQAFNECASLKTVNLPSKLTTIGTYSFANCTSLVTITFPESLKVIGESSFYKCYNLVSINIPKNVNTIKSWAFQHCNKLLDVKNESSLTITIGDKGNGYVGYYAKETHNKESKLTYQDGFIFYTFDSVSYLIGYNGGETNITLPESFGGSEYTVYKYAFHYNSSLEKVSITAGAQSIQNNAFDSCSSLSEFTLGKSVTTIAKNAFLNCSSLSKVIFLGTEAEFNTISVKTPNDAFINAQKVFN